MPDSGSPILQIRSLTAAYQTGGMWMEAVRDVSLEIEPGQVFGLVGESGSGKTTLAMSVMRYLGRNGKNMQGEVVFEGRNLLSLSMREMGEIWGKSIALVPQNSLSVLNPTLRIGAQVAEIFHRHQPADRETVRRRVLEALASVRLEDAERVADSFPHQLSGGMQQRVLIAMATCLKPQLLILDEPTSNLDVTTQASILELLCDLVRGTPAGLYISHNLGIIAQTCDRVGVLYAGELVENMPVEALFTQPLHPYSIGLLESVPRLGENKSTHHLRTIPGSIPPLGRFSQGCIFAERCPAAIKICDQSPRLEEVFSGHLVRCHRWQEIASGSLRPWDARESLVFSKLKQPVPGTRQVLNIHDVSVNYALSHRLAAASFRQSKGLSGGKKAGERTPAANRFEAVHRVSLDIQEGMTIGLVGESGSGKTSLARAVAGLVPSSSGSMELLQIPLPQKLSQRNADLLKNLQMVFQNPDDSLNPYRTVGKSLSRPLIRLGGMSPQQARQEVKHLLEMVHLPGSYAERMPAQLSGGEKQRMAIARAFALRPGLLIADEPVSALDVSVQAAVLNLFDEMQHEHGSGMLFISHDLAVISYIADQIAVIYRGEIVETTLPASLLEAPHHPYTMSLLSAVPDARNFWQVGLEALEEPAYLPSEPFTGGCRFYHRCPLRIEVTCQATAPPWQESGTGTRILCHLSLEELTRSESVSARKEKSRRDDEEADHPPVNGVQA